MPYLEAGGVCTYYEVSGIGDPLVLLHGGLVGSESWFAQRDNLVDAGYQVYLPDRRGHGKSPDVAGPLSYETMAFDTIAFLDAVVDGPAHLIGWSDGAVVAALVAAERPDLVQRMVLIGQYYNSTGKLADGLVEQLAQWRTDPPEFLRAQYADSPDGVDHLPILLGKMIDMWESEPEIALAQLETIAAPTLVLQGDHDDVLLQHSVAVVKSLPAGRLAVLPGTHALPVESPELVNALLIDFLHGDAPTSMGAMLQQ